MTLDEAVELGRAWPSWKRAKGQVGFLGSTSVVIRWADTERIGFDSDVSAGVCDADRFVPDLRDPGTRGHALEQVHEAWSLGISQRRVFVKPDADGWVVRVHTTVMGGVPVERPLIPFNEPRGATEAAALLAARRAAP